MATAAPVFSESQHVAHFFPRAKMTPLPSRSSSTRWIALQNLPRSRATCPRGPRGRRHRGTPRTPLSPPPTRVAVAAAANFPRGPPPWRTPSGHGRLRRRASTRHDGPREGEARRFTRKTATATALTMHARRSRRRRAAKGGSKSRAARRSGPGLGQRPRPRRSARRVRKSLSGDAEPFGARRWGVFGASRT